MYSAQSTNQGSTKASRKITAQAFLTYSLTKGCCHGFFDK
uniref:Uncharacterized protein n=1 Tax=Rhizophora mucronata TaxID=61149 RepID=A0A2P2PMW9_RHIMU